MGGESGRYWEEENFNEGTIQEKANRIISSIKNFYTKLILGRRNKKKKTLKQQKPHSFLWGKRA